MSQAICTIDGCTARLAVKGLCTGHYQRVRIHGDPLADIPLRVSPKRHVGDLPICSADGCDRPARSIERALCGRHYQRWRKYGDADTPYARNAPGRGRWVTGAGYIRISTPNGEEAEHRVVMAEQLGRPGSTSLGPSGVGPTPSRPLRTSPTCRRGRPLCLSRTASMAT
jgi:hypothetical protein